MGTSGTCPTWRYRSSMTDLLQRAISRVEKLPAEQQDSIATIIMAKLDNEEGWAKLHEAPNALRHMARGHDEDH